MSSQLLIIIFSAGTSLFSGLISGLVFHNLKIFSERLATTEKNTTDMAVKHANDLKSISDSQLACKIDCTREFVTAEAYVRSSAYDRQKIDQISDTLNRMAGNMAVIEKLPQISGEIAANITRQILQSQQSNRSTNNG